MSRKLILIVEDNPDDEAFTLRALKSLEMPYQAVVVHDGAEALDYLLGIGAYANRKTSKLPDLILLDLNLPKIDGVGVLKRMRQHQQTALIPVVVLTTSDQEMDRKRCYEQCANSFIRKPVDFRTFETAIHQIGEYWLSLNLPPRDAQ